MNEHANSFDLAVRTIHTTTAALHEMVNSDEPTTVTPEHIAKLSQAKGILEEVTDDMLLAFLPDEAPDEQPG